MLAKKNQFKASNLNVKLIVSYQRLPWTKSSFWVALIVENFSFRDGQMLCKTNTQTKQGILVHRFASYTFGIILIMFW